jgi:hypothetical protein
VLECGLLTVKPALDPRVASRETVDAACDGEIVIERPSSAGAHAATAVHTIGASISAVKMSVDASGNAHDRDRRGRSNGPGTRDQNEVENERSRSSTSGFVFGYGARTSAWMRSWCGSRPQILRG